MPPAGATLDWLDYVVRGVCGAALGAAMGFSGAWYLCDTVTWAATPITAGVVAVLAIRYGDDFWSACADYFWFWRR